MEEIVETYRRGCAEAHIDYALIETSTPFDRGPFALFSSAKKDEVNSVFLSGARYSASNLDFFVIINRFFNVKLWYSINFFES